MNARPLVIGYGNPLRGDDGVGWHVAERLSSDERLSGATVLQRHQLTPELAIDVSEATVVVLIDATVGSEAGSVRIERVEPATGRHPASHQLTPGVLSGLCAALYGRTPDVFVVTCGTESTEPGGSLTGTVAAAMPAIADIVVGLTQAKVVAERSDA